MTLALLSRSRVYLLSPYILLGVALWAFVYAGGLHATLAGVVLALFIPTKVRDDATLRFMMVAAVFYGITTFEGSFLAIRSVNSDFSAAKIAVFAASILSAVFGTVPPTGCCGTPARGRATRQA